MTIVCINRPNRTVKRRFTPADLERIAKHMHSEDGISVVVILAAILTAVGLTTVACKAAKAIDDLTPILTLIEAILKTLAAAAVLDFLIGILKFLQKGLFFTLVGKIIGWLIAILLIIQLWADTQFGVILERFATLREWSKTINEACQIIGINPKNI